MKKQWCMLTNIPPKISYSIPIIQQERQTRSIFKKNDASSCVCQEKEQMVVPSITDCVNQMHKHDLILYVFYVSEPFKLCCDSNDCAGETVLAL